MHVKRRENSFFGLHFDFHAGRQQKHIGDNADPKLITRLLSEVRPDFCQCDTKGHPGNSSYPTKAGYPAPEIHTDILRMWREVTARQGVALYSHYSGIWDERAAEEHPDWQAVRADGEPEKGKMSVFGPYIDQLLIPQLLELALEYKMDGIWLDGECWATAPDYGPYAAAAWKAATGCDTQPKPGEEGHGDYLEFCREGFRAYLDKYCRALHAAAPHYQIASNWMYTAFTPEPVKADVDFISGDYSPTDSLNSARFEARAIIGQRKPWDLMAWGFSTNMKYHTLKTALQLKQEAGVVIALGGGFQVYNAQTTGTVNDRIIPVLAEVAGFAREREALCFKSKPVADVGIIYSGRGFYAEKKDLFTYYSSAEAKDMRSLLFALCDSGFSTEMLMTHHILGRMREYSCLVLPDWKVLEEELIAQLLEYVRSGGGLICAGPHVAKLFLRELKVEIGETSEEKPVYIEQDGTLGSALSEYAEAQPTGSEDIAGFYLQNNRIGRRLTAATVVSCGAGRIAGIYLNNRSSYTEAYTVEQRKLYRSAVLAVCTPKLTLSGPPCVDASLMQKDGQMLINLLNTSGPHANKNLRNFDYIPPVLNLTVHLRLPQKPQNVLFMPENRPLAFSYKDGVLTVPVDRLDIHGVLVIG